MAAGGLARCPSSSREPCCSSPRFVALPALLFTGHGNHRDLPSALGDVLLGMMWVLFVWSAGASSVLRLLLLAASGIDEPMRSRVVAAAVMVVSVTLLAWGHFEAMRVPRVRPGRGAHRHAWARGWTGCGSR